MKTLILKKYNVFVCTDGAQGSRKQKLWSWSSYHFIMSYELWHQWVSILRYCVRRCSLPRFAHQRNQQGGAQEADHCQHTLPLLHGRRDHRCGVREFGAGQAQSGSGSRVSGGFGTGTNWWIGAGRLALASVLKILFVFHFNSFLLKLVYSGAGFKRIWLRIRHKTASTLHIKRTIYYLDV